MEYVTGRGIDQVGRADATRVVVLPVWSPHKNPVAVHGHGIIADQGDPIERGALERLHDRAGATQPLHFHGPGFQSRFVDIEDAVAIEVLEDRAADAQERPLFEPFEMATASPGRSRIMENSRVIATGPNGGRSIPPVFGHAEHRNPPQMTNHSLTERGAHTESLLLSMHAEHDKHFRDKCQSNWVARPRLSTGTRIVECFCEHPQCCQSGPNGTRTNPNEGVELVPRRDTMRLIAIFGLPQFARAVPSRTIRGHRSMQLETDPCHLMSEGWKP